MCRRYSDLIRLKTFKERFLYLNLTGFVAEETFGFDRYLNQDFYRSSDWKYVRDKVIIRDDGFDLGSEERPIGGNIIVHHMNPILPKDIVDVTEYLLQEEFLISTSLATHNAIHYGSFDNLTCDPISRRPGDTLLW